MLHIVPLEFGDKCDIIMELNAGAGGQEAMLFTSEILHMYEAYALYKGWNIEQINVDLSPIGKPYIYTTCKIFDVAFYFEYCLKVSIHKFNTNYVK